MRKILMFFLSIILFITIFISTTVAQVTIEQKLVVMKHDGVNGGDFNVAIQLKGTNLTEANTVGSITMDIVYDNTEIDYVSAIPGVMLPSQGYNLFAQDNTTAIRFGATGGSVGPGTFEGPGYDVKEYYEALITLHFIILNQAAITDLIINPTSNQVGLFDSHANSNNSGVINDQPLSLPINIITEPLPVELASFTVNLIEDKINLNWSTATEINNFGFDIEKMYEPANEWEKIGFVQGNGNSNSTKVYSFSDKPSVAGKYFYRLKQIDIDGNFEYSDEVFIELLQSDSYALTQNYPNPFNPRTKISFTIPEAGNVKIIVYNAIGELVKTILDEFRENGVYTLDFDASSLNSGIYFYKLQTNNYSEMKKMILLK